MAGQRQEAEKKSGDDTLVEPLQKLNIQFLPPHTYNIGKYLGKSLRNNSKPALCCEVKGNHVSVSEEHAHHTFVSNQLHYS